MALLLAAGADPCATDELGRDALRQAREGARDAGEPRRPLIGSLTFAMAARGGAAGGWLARPLSAESKRAVSRVRAEIPFAEYALGDLLLLESTRVVELPARVGAAAKAGFRMAYTERAIADLDLRVESLERQLAEISASKGRRWLTAQRAARKSAIAEFHGAASPGTNRAAVGRRTRRSRLVLLRGERSALPVLYAFGGWNDAPEPTIMASVLMHWSKVYGAEVMAIGRDTLELAVDRPPTTARTIARAAEDAYCFCPDVDDARGMVRTGRWRFWWD